ncbi:hypothetical protein FB45DRAFT_1051690 [Roridomyces roridus]|uniref:Uncharacterized protein n=1 Tax=Roridomyces roridus TaxID=1738132 RepID=A0AAD7FZY0_9AGAR|nr:hypothetical protein FB45DRAFT_1051690 [Roridomyces roridus]
MDLHTTVASLPQALWNLYVEHLWNWTDHPSSWISRIAYTARVLSILLILPLVILILLDIASYGIARTLGVIDDVKASTSDKETIHNKEGPLVHIYETSPTPTLSSSASIPDSGRDTDTEPQSQSELSSSSDSLAPLPRLTIPSDSEEPRTYFTENSSQLSGAGVFSPAASRPPSPTITRRALPVEDKLVDSDEGITLRKRGKALSAPQDD